MTEPQPPAIGVMHNGHVWDGTRWNPAPSQTQQAWPPPSGRGGGAYAVMPMAFADPRYAYGLTRRAAQDIHFLARYWLVFAWIHIISLCLALIWSIVSFAGILAAVQTVTHLPR